MICLRPPMFFRKCLSTIVLLSILSVLAVTRASYPASAAGPWVFTDSLHSARYAHTATALGDGRVLVTGGATYIPGAMSRLSDDGHVQAAGANSPLGIVPFSSTEIYDPSTGHWTLTNAMRDARVFHTATRLSNGKVLVAGGLNTGGSELNSAELYDPSTGNWHVTGSMNTPRVWHTATLLADGRVLVVGGFYARDPVTHIWTPTSTAEVYDPTQGTWDPVTGMGTARAIHAAARLSDETVLIVGGELGGGSSTRSSEIYHPTTGLWSLGGDLNVARAYHRAVLLPNGKVLVAGGGYWSGAPEGHYYPTDTAEEYQPNTNSWNLTGALGASRMLHSMVLLSNGEVLVAGGFQGPHDGDNILASAEVYRQDTGMWSAIPSMSVARSVHTATPISGGRRVLMVGGRATDGETATAELYLGYDNLRAGAYLPLIVR
jgi:N-acetylneuraminic acid mutarotase